MKSVTFWSPKSFFTGIIKDEITIILHNEPDLIIPQFIISCFSVPQRMALICINNYITIILDTQMTIIEPTFYICLPDPFLLRIQYYYVAIPREH